VIINATPVGQANEPPVIPTKAISPAAVLVDLVYRPPVTPLIRAARNRGAIAHSGLGMLLHQAALSFEIWTGVEAPMEAMSAAGLWELAKTADATH
jgi:shikimate dehydrogenase